MGGCIDLTGQRFGRLTVIKRAENYISPSGNIYTQWWCQCDCKGINSLKIIRSGHLKSGSIKSCGCLLNEKYHDLTGQKFNRLTVIKKVDRPSNSKNTQSYWLCKCNCGSNVEIIVGSGDLKSGNTQSCGCLHKEMASKSNKKYNTYDLTSEYGIGYTSKGDEFYFDLEDYHLIKDYCWYIRSGYVVAYDINNDEKYIINMHRLVMNCPDDMEIDHIFHQTNDNRKSELRFVTKSQNGMNSGLQSNNTSGITGVSWNKKFEKWNAYIILKNEKINLGSFDNFEDAVNIRKEAEDIYFREYKYMGEC